MLSDKPVQPHSGRPRAFTLIELLLVMSIIAVLIALLLPVLSAARSSAKTSSCGANLRNIGMGIEMYVTNQKKNELPDSGSGPMGGDLTGSLEPYTGALWGRGIWVDPGHEEFQPGVWTSSYGYNWQYLLQPGPGYPHTRWDGFGNPGMRMDGIKNPSKAMSFIDIDAFDNPDLWSYVARPNDPTRENGIGRVHLRHTDNANALFLDGRVTMVGDEFIDPQREYEFWDFGARGARTR